MQYFYLHHQMAALKPKNKENVAACLNTETNFH